MPNALLAHDVPIIGQRRVEHLGSTLVCMMRCDCGTKEPIQVLALLGPFGVSGAEATCPHCRSIIQLQSLTIGPNGQVNFNLTVKSPMSES